MYRVETARAARARKELTDFKRLVMLLGSQDVPGLRRIMAGIVKRQNSPDATLNLLERAISSSYSPRGNFSRRDIDLAFYVKSLGGPQLLFAMEKACGYASVSTVRRQANVPFVLASSEIPSLAEIHTNILSQLAPSVRPPLEMSAGWSSLPGNSIMFDDVGVDPKVRYCVKRDLMLGPGREKVHLIDLRVKSMEAIGHAREAIWGNPPIVRLATNATVVALGPLANYTSYAPIPLVVSGSDSSETGAQLAAWMRDVIGGYAANPCGAVSHGPIWNIASDGASTFRAAKYEICMEVNLSEIDYGLFEVLSKLPGLNLSTSRDGIVTTGDPKHVFKRIRTMLCNDRGTMVGEKCLTPMGILDHLASVDSMTRDDARLLLDPIDKQNVPKAVKLVETLGKVPNDHHLLAGDSKEREALAFLSRTLLYFILPFIAVNMSLSEQVRSLATFAHLAFALWRIHGQACFTGALYADMQSIIKSIMFSIARMQRIDGNLLFYLILEGTDRLEGLFGHLRSQTHDRNFDLLTLSERLAIAASIIAILLRNPDLDRGHRRTDLRTVSGVDHINIKSWVGDVRVGLVNLVREWLAARQVAIQELKDFYKSLHIIDFEAWLSEVDVDFAQPCGIPVGTALTPADSRSEDERLAPVELVSSAPDVLSDELMQSLIALEPEDDNEDDLDANLDDLDASQETLQPDSDLDSQAWLKEHPGIPTVQFKPESTPRSLMIDGKEFYKASLVPSLTDKDSCRVTSRTLRSQGLTLRQMHGRSRFEDMNTGDETDTIRAKDPVAALVQCGTALCLAVFETLWFHVGSEPRPRSMMTTDDFEQRGSETMLTVQVLKLEQRLSESDATISWRWTRDYIRVEPETQDGRITLRNYTIRLRASQAYPLAPDLLSCDDTLDSKPTWEFPCSQLDAILQLAWSQLEPNGADIMATLLELPKIECTTLIPYCDLAGTRSLRDYLSHLMTLIRSTIANCHRCSSACTTSPEARS
jgi:hypothetical protein